MGAAPPGRGFLLAGLALALACGREGSERTAGALSEPTVRDSAGVRIVENGAMPAARWRVDAEPLFTVGWDEGDPDFTWPQSGRILPDGGAVVGEFAEGRIYRLGPDGTVVETVGRKGEGPGEFQGFDAILLEGDSILVSDGRLLRVTLVAPDGAVRTAPLPSGSFLHHASATLSDGRLLLVPGDGYSGVAETRQEWVFQTQPILAASPEGGLVDTVAELPHLRRWYGSRGASPGPVQVKGRAGAFAEGFAWARSDEPGVRWYDGAGRLVQVARWDEEPAPLTPEWRSEMRRIYEEAYRSRGSEEAFVAAQLATLEEGLDRHQGPLPYWDRFLVDRLGNAWLSDYTLPGQAPRRWSVVARDGAVVGWVDLGGVTAILDVTDDRILGVRRDELDVPAVTMFALIKP